MIIQIQPRVTRSPTNRTVHFPLDPLGDAFKMEAMTTTQGFVAAVPQTDCAR